MLDGDDSAATTKVNARNKSDSSNSTTTATATATADAMRELRLESNLPANYNLNSWSVKWSNRKPCAETAFAAELIARRWI